MSLRYVTLLNAIVSHLHLATLSNTNRTRACIVCTSFAHSLRPFQSGHHTWDSILSNPYQTICRCCHPHHWPPNAAHSLRTSCPSATANCEQFNWIDLRGRFRSHQKIRFAYRFLATGTEFLDARRAFHWDRL